MSEEYPLEIERIMRQTQSRIMSDIVRRIKTNSQITRTADWQLDRLHELGEGKKEVRRIIRKYLGLTDKQVEELYKQAAESGHAYNKSLYEAVGENFIPYVENKGLQQLVSAMVAQTKGEMKNITQSMGFAVKQGNKLVFKEIAKYYQETLDGAITDIASGAFDYNSVIKRVINEMTNSGLRTVDYASGWTNRIDVAARRAVMTGLNQLTGQIQEQNAETLNTNKYETSWHSTARPEHQLWQGRVYSYDELVSICGLGDVAGLKGANCRHDYFPFVEGVSVRVYTDEQLEEMNAKENEKRKYNGKEYTAYEATQRQRYLETAMRAQRQKVKLLQEANADEKDITAVKCKYRKLSKEYTDFSKKMGLPQERQRIYSDGLGKINMNAPTKSNSQALAKTEPIAKSENGGIISREDKEMAVDGVHYIGKIDRKVYKCVTEDIVTDEVIITDERILHIKERHPNDFEKYCHYMQEVIENPEYIIEANKPNTALILKSFSSGTEHTRTILRLITSADDKNFKNSIITFMKTNEKEWNRLLKNKKILYKSE